MDYTAHVLDGPNVFTETNNYLNLKLQSPMPTPFKGAHKEETIPASLELSPTKPGPETTPSDDGLGSSVISLGQELRNQEVKKVLSRSDIYKAVLAQVGGKDRLAKVCAYVLNIVKYYLSTTRRFVINEKFTNLSLDPRQHYKTPLRYLKLLLFLNSTMLEKRIGFITAHLSAFRYSLRFGGTPYRIQGFLSKFDQFFKNPNAVNFTRIYLNEDSLGDLINLWYGIFDELELLYKLNVLTNQKSKKFISQQASWAWYADVLLGWKTNWCKLQKNKDRQVQINIQHQVRQRASLLSKKLVEGIGSSPLRQQLMHEFNNKSSLSGGALVEELRELKHQEKIITLDLVRLSFDFVCVNIDALHFKLHPLVYLGAGAISGSCGLSKVWLMSKKDLEG